MVSSHVPRPFGASVGTSSGGNATRLKNALCTQTVGAINGQHRNGVCDSYYFLSGSVLNLAEMMLHAPAEIEALVEVLQWFMG